MGKNEKQFVLVTIALILRISAQAQYTDLTLPETSMRASISSRIGITDITVRYSAPPVAGRKIWGSIVPFNSDVPWRAGANECTSIEFNTNVEVEGQAIKAGRYGLFMIPSQTGDWTVLLSSNWQYWGGYYYDPKDEALRVKVRPESCEFRERLAYVFLNATNESAIVALEWDRLRIPLKVKVNTVKETLNSLRRELNGTKGNNWYAWIAAARYCLRNKTNYDEALVWTETAMNGRYGGYQATTNFLTLFTKYQLLTAVNRSSDAEPILAKAMPLLDSGNDHLLLAGTNLARKDFKTAISVLEAGAKKFPKNYLLLQELGNAYYASGERKKGIEILEQAISLTPKEYQQISVDALETLKAGLK